MTPEGSLPEGLLLGFYGDDFTGSTDAMEVTALAGLPTILFTRTPDAADLAAFADRRVIGIAGQARAQDPDWMERHLDPALAALAALKPPILQYKVCSTFDSAPGTGSIGRAIMIGRRHSPSDWTPVVVGAPQLGRWMAFAHLFAAAHGVPYRLDRHPTMSRHPVTPMLESDLRLHLAAQTDLPILSIDLAAIATGRAESLRQQAKNEAAIAFVDVADPATQVEAGRLLWTGQGPGPLFSAASSGLQYALIAFWRAAGLLTDTPPTWPKPAPVNRLLVLSGSCSPVTAAQIDAAEAAGHALIRLDVVQSLRDSSARVECGRVSALIEEAMTQGRHVVVYAARSMDDPALGAMSDAARAADLPLAAAQARIGDLLAALAADAVLRLGLRRLVVGGGDTSSRVVAGLPIRALEVKHPLSPGAPMCHCHGADPAFDGLELALKGGQLGGLDYFVKAAG